MQDYKKLIVWQKAHELTLKIYKATETLPKSEMYGITSQLRRASSSIPANVAEGSGRKSKNEFKQFLVIAAGSASEVEYYLLLAKDLNYIEQNIFTKLSQIVSEIRKMLFGLIEKLK